MMANATHHEPTSPNDRATEFQAAPDTGEHFNGYTLMVEAYAALWLIMMLWLVMVWRKQVTLASRVAGLESAVARAASKRAGGGATEKSTEPETAR